MRRLLFALLATAALAGCTSPCEELGNRLCECRDQARVSKRSCENSVRDQLKKLDPSSDQESTCDAYLKTCEAPSGLEFCNWVRAEEGELACGLALPECSVDADCGTGFVCSSRRCAAAP